MHFHKILAFSLMLASVACSHHDNPAPTPPATNPPSDTATSTTQGTDSAYWQTEYTGSTAPINDIWFTDTLHGIVADYDGFIYTSSDGGHTWNKTANLGTVPEVIFFLSASQGYVVGTTKFATTSDGGQTWTIKSRPDSVNTLASTIPACQFFSPATGYISTGAGIYRTDDTGTTWKLLKGDAVTALYFINVDSGTIYANPNKMSTTSNGGATWQLLDTVSPRTTFGSNAELKFTDNLHGWFMSPSRVAITTNGGISWQNVFQTSWNDALIDLKPLSSQFAYLATMYHLYKTTDGGATWQRELLLPKLDSYTTFVEGLFFTDEHHGWAACYGGRVLRYRR